MNKTVATSEGHHLGNYLLNPALNTEYLALHDSVEPLDGGGWQDGLSPVADEAGVEDHLEARPDQHQVAHNQRGLIDQEVVRGEQEARYQGENNTLQREMSVLRYFITSPSGKFVQLGK